MNKNDEIEQENFEVRQSVMKQEKNLSKSESRFKSKFKSLKKLPHPTTTTTTSAVEKARTFFRSLELKRYHDSDQTFSAICQDTTSDISPPPFPILINEEIKYHDALLNPITRTTNISISKNLKVEKINPTDMIVYRVMHNDQDKDKLPLNYFQQKYKQYTKPSLLFPKQYYNELLNKKTNRNYFTSIDKRDSYLRTSLPTSVRHSTRIYPPSYYSSSNHEVSSHDRILNSLYDNPLHIYHQMESSFLVPSSTQQPVAAIIRPLPTSSSSSVLTWSQCVSRLNSEYRSTINALQQTKEYFEDVYPNSSNSISNYANLVTHEMNNLSNNETKKSSSVTFRLPSPAIPTKSSPLRIEHRIEKSKIPAPVMFAKPKLVKPIELYTFSKFEPTSSATNTDEKLESIASIIKKFNDLSNSISSTIEKCQMKEKLISKHEETSNQSSPTELILTDEEDQIENNRQEEEETIYTIETIYKRTNNKDHQPLLVTQEKITAEQFQSVYEKQSHDIQTNHNLSQEKVRHNESKLLSINENSYSNEFSSNGEINHAPEIPTKNTNKFISQIPKRTTTTSLSTSRIKPPSKFILSSNQVKSPPSTISRNTTTSMQTSTGITNSESQSQTLSVSDKRRIASSDRTNSTSPIRKNYVKSMVRQINTTLSPSSTISSSVANKRTCCRISIQPTTFINKNAV